MTALVVMQCCIVIYWRNERCLLNEKKKCIAERFQFSKFFNDLSVYVPFRGPIGFRYLCCLQQVWDPDLCTSVSIYCISTIYLSVHQKYGLHSLCHLAITLRSLLSLLSLHQACGLLYPFYIFLLQISPSDLSIRLRSSFTLPFALPAWNLFYISPWDLFATLGGLLWAAPFDPLKCMAGVNVQCKRDWCVGMWN
jgi:hypothetical protein